MAVIKNACRGRQAFFLCVCTVVRRNLLSWYFTNVQRFFKLDLFHLFAIQGKGISSSIEGVELELAKVVGFLFIGVAVACQEYGNIFTGLAIV